MAGAIPRNSFPELNPFADELTGWFYQLFTVDGTWVLQDLDNDKLRVKASSLEQFFKDNPEI